MCRLPDCAQSLTPSTPFLYFYPQGQKVIDVHSQTCSRSAVISQIPQNPPESITKSCSKALQLDQSLPPPCPPSSPQAEQAVPSWLLHAYQRAHSHIWAQFETRRGTWWFIGPQCHSKKDACFFTCRPQPKALPRAQLCVMCKNNTETIPPTPTVPFSLRLCAQQVTLKWPANLFLRSLSLSPQIPEHDTHGTQSKHFMNMLLCAAVSRCTKK